MLGLDGIPNTFDDPLHPVCLLGDHQKQMLVDVHRLGFGQYGERQLDLLARCKIPG